jgi:alpha-tubulin suppressor-like RCC1 family protein
LVPTPVAGPAFERVAVGRFFTCAVSREHRVLCTGANESGQLGFGDTMRRNAFEPLAYPFE